MINVDMLKAPRAKHTVKYVNDDGTEISVQTVLDGEKANVPDSPKKPDIYLPVGVIMRHRYMKI